MNIDGVEYQVLIATDVDRDSMQWECYRVEREHKTLLFEVVRYDGRKEWELVQHAKSIPFSVIEFATKNAKNDLGPFFSG